MTRVDFYILAAGDAGDPINVICRLCDKATAAGQRVYIHAPDTETAVALDSRLWSFRQGSFIAHERQSDTVLEAPLPAVLIGAGEPQEAYRQIMINLDAEVPPCFSRFERVLELVHGDEAQRKQGRKRYKFYRDRGYPMDTHDLGK